MKKIVSLAVAALLTASVVAACSSTKDEPKATDAPAAAAADKATEEPSKDAPAADTKDEETPTDAPAVTDAPTDAPAAESTGGFELALITDVGTIDDKSFNQGSWEGLVEFADESGKTRSYYQPTEQSDDAYIGGIELAIKGGAKLVVTPGFLFEYPIFKAQDIHPDVKFILIDGNPHNEDYSEFKTADNTVGVTYAEDEAGYLAGYAAVKDGYRKLGFMGGMAVPAVVRYGYGFVQGADDAAAELGLAKGDVTVNYHYTGGFIATPEIQAMAASWFQGGVEVVFAAAGGAGNSVMAAADQTNGKVIGVDVDQSSESPTVISSALKGLKQSVYDCAKLYAEGNFPGGQDLVFSAKNNGVGLSMDTSKWNNFSNADYDAVYATLASGNVAIFSADEELKDFDGKVANVTEFN